MRITEDMQVQARALIADRLGLDFPESRQADLERGLRQALDRAAVSSPETYLAWLASLPNESAEWRRLASFLTVGETYFFRDRSCMDALEQQVLPVLIESRRSAGIFRLRVWSAGCSTGAEPYSLAILLHQLIPDHQKWALTILATDLNPAALEVAQRGLYGDWALRETPPRIIDGYFHRRGKDTFELDPAIRRMVVFAPLNLVQTPFPSLMTNTSAMDLIICRNVLMYFTGTVQRAVMAKLQEALVTGGWLVVAPAEASAEPLRPLMPVNFPGAIFYRRTQGHAASTFPEIQRGFSMPEPLHPWLEQTDVSADVSPPAVPVAALAEGQASAPAKGADLEDARILADQGSLEQARCLCETLLAEDRLNADAALLLAAIYQEQGETAAALEALRKTLYLAPHSVAAHFMRGCLLYRQGDYKRGRRSMETVLSLLCGTAPDVPVPGSEGLTAGRLLETTRAYLEMQG